MHQVSCSRSILLGNSFQNLPVLPDLCLPVVRKEFFLQLGVCCMDQLLENALQIAKQYGTFGGLGQLNMEHILKALFFVQKNTDTSADGVQFLLASALGSQCRKARLNNQTGIQQTLDIVVPGEKLQNIDIGDPLLGLDGDERTLSMEGLNDTKQFQGLQGFP